MRVEKVRDRLTRDAMHNAQARPNFANIFFKFSHRRMIRLARFGKSRVTQLDHLAVAKAWRVRRAGK
jgi:hypothetical protein